MLKTKLIKAYMWKFHSLSESLNRVMDPDLNIPLFPLLESTINTSKIPVPNRVRKNQVRNWPFEPLPKTSPGFKNIKFPSLTAPWTLEFKYPILIQINLPIPSNQFLQKDQVVSFSIWAISLPLLPAQSFFSPSHLACPSLPPPTSPSSLVGLALRPSGESHQAAGLLQDTHALRTCCALPRWAAPLLRPSGPNTIYSSISFPEIPANTFPLYSIDALYIH